MQATCFKQTLTPVPPELAPDPASSPGLSAPRQRLLPCSLRCSSISGHALPMFRRRALLGPPRVNQGFCWQEPTVWQGDSWACCPDPLPSGLTDIWKAHSAPRLSLTLRAVADEKC